MLDLLERNDLFNITSFICDDPNHFCFGMEVKVVEGQWNGIFFHVEKYGNRYNVQIDRLKRFNQTLEQMQDFMRRIL